jgi:hypothetical protein
MDYQVARGVSEAVSVAGWAGFIFSLAGAAMGLMTGAPMVVFLTAAGTAAGSLFIVATGQITRATVDNANHTRRMVELLERLVADEALDDAADDNPPPRVRREPTMPSMDDELDNSVGRIRRASGLA